MLLYLVSSLKRVIFSPQVFANEVNAHRDQIIELDQTGNQLKFLSQKQDVVLIKNLLVSVQSRWEKVVQRSIERGRSLDDARKRAKQVSCKRKILVCWTIRVTVVGSCKSAMLCARSFLLQLISYVILVPWSLEKTDWLARRCRESPGLRTGDIQRPRQNQTSALQA